VLFLCLASGDRGRDSSAKEFVSSIFHAANKRIRRSRDKSSGRMRESGERDGTLSEPTSFSERNIDHEVELRQLQELLRTGGTVERVDETDVRTTLASPSSHSGSTVSSTSSTISAETKDIVSGSQSSKTADTPTRRECRSSASLKERRTFFFQNGCNQPAVENTEQKRLSADCKQLADGKMLQETVVSTAATCAASDPFASPALPSMSSPGPGDIAITVPSSRAAKMQQVVEQHMQQLADDLQRTFNATAALSPPDVSPVASRHSVPREQETTQVHLSGISAGDIPTTCAADSQSVTSDYSTMSSVCGGRDTSCLRKQLVSGDLEIPGVPGYDPQKISDRSTVGRCRNRNDPTLGTPRSQSSGNFSLTSSDPVETSLCTTASAMELSQDSIDSAADRSDQLSLSLSSHMSDSQISESDNLLQTISVADKHSFDLAQPSGTVDHKPSSVNNSRVQLAVSEVEQFSVSASAGSVLQSDAATSFPTGLAILNTSRTESETDVVLVQPRCSSSSAKPDICGVYVDKSAAEVPSADRVLAEPDQVTPCQENIACSDCTDAGSFVPSADADDKRISTLSSKEQFLQSERPVHRLVRRHTLGGTVDLAMCAVDPQSESPRSVQLVHSQNEGRLSAWQRLRPAVKDRLPNFGVWLATQRQLHHACSSPALLVGAGVALTSASCLPSSQLFV